MIDEECILNNPITAAVFIVFSVFLVITFLIGDYTWFVFRLAIVWFIAYAYLYFKCKEEKQ